MSYIQCLCKTDRIVMKMILFQLCSLLLIHKAESAGCLLKPGFGLEEGHKLVNYWKSPLPINVSECQTQCDNTVKGFCGKLLFSAF